MTKEELIYFYSSVAETKHYSRETDLNSKCLKAILNNLIGPNILDIACGRGFLTKLIAKNTSNNVIGIDIDPPEPESNTTNLNFIRGFIENIPFPDKYFDTVISAHTLEHVPDIKQALSELRRVTKKRLLIVVPKQREYKYTFDFHIHFFPYMYRLLNALKPLPDKWDCIELDGDFFYREDHY